MTILRGLVLVSAVISASVPLAPARAQSVRGVVTERATGAPLSGVLVTLVSGDTLPGAPALVTLLTSDRGVFVLRAPAPGAYRVIAKRIGVRRFVSEEIQLASGQERTIDISLEPVVFQLPEVKVTTNIVCASRESDGPRLTSLWEEARAALTATQISLRDRLFRARIVRYKRELEPRTLRVESETRRQVDGVTERPFVSVSVDSLSRFGYRRVERDNQISYSAPDADVLLSTRFLRDHCFSVAEGRGERAGLTGMAFEPVPTRQLPDVRGTLWLDARTFELRLVEFRYTRLPPASNMSNVGGEVHFARLPSGAWIVNRWFIRMPRYSERTSLRSTGVPGEPPVVTYIVVALTEEGGNVTAEGLRTAEKPATLTGTVSDSAGVALPAAAVRLQGTQFVARSDSVGRYRFDSLPPGAYTVVAEHQGYDALGMLIGQQDIILEQAAASTVAFRAPTTEAIVARLCDGKKPARRMGILRVTILDSTSALPVRNVALRLNWKEYGGPTGGPISTTPRGIDATTDARGSVAFCELPADLPLSLVVMRARTESPLAELRVRQDDIDTRTFRIRP